LRVPGQFDIPAVAGRTPNQPYAADTESLPTERVCATEGCIPRSQIWKFLN